MTAKQRSFVCPGCRGTVSVNKGRRSLTLEQVEQTHNQTCPGRTKP